jgi:hypothetical protein
MKIIFDAPKTLESPLALSIVDPRGGERGSHPGSHQTQGPTWCFVAVLGHACMHNAASSIWLERGKGNIHIDFYTHATTKNKKHLQHPDQHHLLRDLLMQTAEVTIYLVDSTPTTHSQPPSFQPPGTSTHRHYCIFGTSSNGL